MQASPGVYAILAGSGLSSGAGIPAAWAVVEDLIRRVATADGVDLDEAGVAPEAWWAQQDHGAARYDVLLKNLAPTDPARRMLLRGYFDPPAGAAGPIPPSPGHRVLAELVAAGRVRVVVTTNFDRLIERAIDAAGVAPQVISNPRHVAGMVPLVHAPATVIKVHGDYAAGPLRNTGDELRSYPRLWSRLLAEIFDTYGLVVVGWSATWDAALAGILEASPNHRFPVYWTARGDALTEEARRLVANRRALVVPIVDADEFFVDLGERLRRLDQVAARRERPTLLKWATLGPNSTQRPAGWAMLPLLQVRVAAVVVSTPGSAFEFIRQRHRLRLTAALDGSVVVAQLRDLAALGPAAAAELVAQPSGPYTEQPAAPAVPERWEKGDLDQTSDTARYRLGGDASAGVAALFTFQPPLSGDGSERFLILDVGISVQVPLALVDVARLIRDSLVLLTGEVPDALEEILPADAAAARVEVHLLASTVTGLRDGQGATNRENDIRTRVDLGSLGPAPPSRAMETVVFAASIDGPLSVVDAAELTIDGLDYLALEKGWTDTDDGIAGLRAGLGLPARSS